jgi:alcohol-forming fatty acyl-CoA reductase
MTFEIKKFYSNKTIFISGCTGFLAKITLEKIIRTCSDFKKIFVVMRDKKGFTLQERLEKEILSSLMF